MRISSQNSQFIFNFPENFIPVGLQAEFEKMIEKNFIPYDTIADYINSTIKEIVVPSISFDNVTQPLKRGKQVNWKSAKSIFDTFNSQIDITFRAVDSYLNYFLLLQILTDFYLDNDKEQLEYLNVGILDKDGALIYNIIFNEVLLNSLSEIRLGYQQYDINEKQFTMSFTYNFIDIVYELDNEDDPISKKSIFDMPINFKPGGLDK